MGFDKVPAGSRGRGEPLPSAVVRVVTRVMERYHRLRRDRFMGMDLLYLTTVGAKSGRRRRVPLTRFPEEKGWLIVASVGGAREHPAWYHNIAAHPDQVWAEVGGTTFRVRVEQLEGDERATAWERITAEQPRYRRYADKTDRQIPILRLIPAT
ncbi:nitroreductase family deazaflavin-dependent oxidoreductase [Nocardia sp. CDC159]|uniref:Nitroreductase family deazaflavin-dependent oxidoreductase n=1 Tax=Nocardia pulmonis TaxID=2951408 RepID=A0A9X2E336_9NOCA|nr:MULTISPECIES: nitroreductase/quinone reductase family protein [Nocardia]MCM6773382.1 nitroreductase family deazaflavin-dependent oxidoreductase [Nocardia pulmonis]MCM6786269.1 nitroreductase family deazaflavin-dependent oxidoreductase [Nocardia sp. CDC159]